MSKNRFVYADVHYGDPGTTSIKYECEFAPFKPRTDVLVNGHAYAPEGKPVKEMLVSLEIGRTKKEVRVVGDRRWERGLFGLKASSPMPFVKMPLVYERAFGGSDHTHQDPKNRERNCEIRWESAFIRIRIRKPSKARRFQILKILATLRKLVRYAAPMGFGHLGRGWQPRIKLAGTYDDQWLKDRFPFPAGRLRSAVLSAGTLGPTGALFKRRRSGSLSQHDRIRALTS